MMEQIFQPFTDRLSRDIRNDLSESFVMVLEQKSLLPAEQIANEYLKNKPAKCYFHYIKTRLQRYGRCLDTISDGPADPLWQGLVLWDEQLFFEVHEILEHAWMNEQGKEKLFLQAMIRAAGVYIKLEAGYPEPAARIAAKALPVLRHNCDRLSQYTEPDKLINAIKNVATPPLLLA